MFRVFMIVCSLAGGNCSYEGLTDGPTFTNMAQCKQHIAIFEPLINQEMLRDGHRLRAELRCREDI